MNLECQECSQPMDENEDYCSCCGWERDNENN